MPSAVLGSVTQHRGAWGPVILPNWLSILTAVKEI